MIISRSNFGNLLEPNLNVVFISSWKQGLPKMEWKGVYDEVKADGHEYRSQELPAFGPMPEMAEGSPFTMDTAQQGDVVNATIRDFGLGFRITKNLVDDWKYRGGIVKKYVYGLQKSARHTQNKNAADLLNYAYSTDSRYLYPDGKPLLSSSNRNAGNNTTFSNVLSTQADFSELANEEADIQISLMEDAGGLLSSYEQKCIIIPPQIKFDVHRVLASDLRPTNTGLSTPLTYQPNDVNAYKSMNGMPEVKIMRHLTNPKNVFWITDEQNGLTFINRKPLTPDMQKNQENRSMSYYLFGRWEFKVFSKRFGIGNGNRP